MQLFTRHKWTYLLLALISVVLVGCEGHPSILNPKGVIAFEERRLIFDSAALMLIVLIPVIIMSFDFVTHYRSGNKKTEYRPNWAHSVFLESIWWGVPIAIILVIGTMTWISTHKLDPFRKLNYPGKVERIDVIALPWKWLFIYPEKNIATVNHLVLPNKTQVEFHFTNDNVPMSSFMVPQLGSQIYTMAGMRTRLHLIPTHIGKVEGMNTQYNGDGFSDMRFDVDVVSEQDYNDWTKKVASQYGKLNNRTYNKIRQPEINAKVTYFSGVEQNLFNSIMHAYHMSGQFPMSIGIKEHA